jgi:coenzyme F420-reducing hydrogenase delta subunit/ferredoxin
LIVADAAIGKGSPARGPRLPAALDRAFDRVFGAAANPLRHLGALGFFLFWVVVASGVYLYLFFDIGPDGPYRSVERLTHAQWYAGGVMRSLHRYASDALVAVAGLHWVKELAQRHYGGFRWFSWTSGVVLVPLVLACGIVGYWLVWDERAQFIAIATADWFGALPGLDGSLVRNFIAPEALSDRFFVLLAFLHIGLSLALLGALFVHVQRLNYADLAPARGLAWGMFAALLALSLARPAGSAAPADLATAPQVLALDWFYLALYPLVYAWSAEAVWVVAGALVLGLALLPLAAQGARAPVACVDPAHCNGCARCLADCPYAAIEMRSRTGGRRGQKIPVVQAGLCAGCGICTGACPASTPFRSGERLAAGIDMPQQPINALRERLEAALAGPPRLVVFGCDHGAELRALAGPDTVVFGLLCSGMLPPAFVEYALRTGARGVVVTGCRPGECAFRLGNAWVEQRFSGRREPHLRAAAPRERLLLLWCGRGEEARLVREAKAFAARLASVPPRGAPPPRRLQRSRPRVPLELTQLGP